MFLALFIMFFGTMMIPAEPIWILCFSLFLLLRGLYLVELPNMLMHV